MILLADQLQTELGSVWMLTDGQSLRALDFVDDLSEMETRAGRRFGEVSIRRENDPLGVRSRLEAYFAGDPAALSAIPVNPGGTPFQARVWNALCEIPYGTTETYGTLAARLGAPKASRAVGMANSRNPIAIVIPCHRVIGARNGLGGYAGGLDRKRRLLDLEGVRLNASEPIRAAMPLQPQCV
jgi:methylated-DNA-[protein]-cysteine S-methyltransferase